MGFLQFIKNIIKPEKTYDEEITSGIAIEKVRESQDVALDVVKRIQKITKDNKAYLPEYEMLIEELTTYEKVNTLPSSVVKELELMAENYAEGMLKKENFKKVVNKEHPDIVYLEQYTDDIPKVIEALKRVEDIQRVVKRDLDYLEGEKADIYYKRNRYNKALEFLKILLVVIGVSAVIATIIFSALIYNEVDVMIPALITVGIIAGMGIYIFVFRRYLIYEIKMTYKLDKRAVNVTNKIKIKYVSNQQYLDYAYSKYRVNSCEMLEMRYENLKKVKRNKERFQKLNSNITALAEDIEHMLHKYNVEFTHYVIDNLDYFSSKDGRALLINGVKDKKEEYGRLIKKNEKEIEFMFGLLKDVDPDITMEGIMNYRLQ